LLKLDCSKARSRLGWRGIWDVPQAIAATVDWYRTYYDQDHAQPDMITCTEEQIADYAVQAANQGMSWSV
jgi:CDP-glucose 4,6-dehydratase